MRNSISACSKAPEQHYRRVPASYPMMISPPAQQQGAALAVSMVFLLVLTILGVNALGTTSLEERMAGNLQEQNRAFQAAETGVVRIMQDASTFSTSQDGTAEAPITDLPDGTTVATLARKFLQTTDAGRTKNTAFGKSTTFNHFNIKSEGETDTRARITVNQGVYQLGPGAPEVLYE